MFADPHHFNANPDPNPNPAFHFNEYPDPAFRFKNMRIRILLKVMEICEPLHWSIGSILSLQAIIVNVHDAILTLMRIRIQLFTLMRIPIRIQLLPKSGSGFATFLNFLRPFLGERGEF
jgi:hypothetical protein